MVYQNRVKVLTDLPSIPRLYVAPLVDHGIDGAEDTDVVPDVYYLSQKNSLDGLSSVVTFNVENLKSHRNASGASGYWVGLSIPVQDRKFGTKYLFTIDGETYSSDDVSTWLTRTTEINGKLYNTIYLSEDDWSAVTEGELKVIYNDLNSSVEYTFAINFNVSVYSDEPPVEPPEVITVDVKTITYITVVDTISYLNTIIVKDGVVYSDSVSRFLK